MKLREKEQAIRLRKKGYSIKEIAKILSVSKSTASVWVRVVKLDNDALYRLKKRHGDGIKKSQQIKKEKRNKLLSKIEETNNDLIFSVDETIGLDKIFCALLHWCEGNKDDRTLRFTNSDPEMIRTFLYLLRSSFKLDESKFRINLHLHEYHNEELQKKFWSNVTNIPLKQFLKIYKKPNTGKRSRKNYPGCVSIRYYDHILAKQLDSLWKIFSKKYQ